MKWAILLLMILIANVFMGPILWIAVAIWIVWALYRKASRSSRRY